MKVVINSQTVEVPAGSTIESILAGRGIALDHTAVERNGEILDPTMYGSAVSEGDEIVVVRFVGGG